MAEQTLDISWKTIVKVFIAGFIFYVLFLARDIVIWFFFALIISILIEPAIKFFKGMLVPRILAAILVYVLIFGVLGLLIYFISPIFIFEINQLYQNIPDYFEKINPLLKDLGFNVAENFDVLTLNLVGNLNESSGSIFKAITIFFGGISSAAFIFALSFFISLEERGVERVLMLFTPKKYEEYIVPLFQRVQMKVSGWFGARILSCIFVGVLSFAVFFLLGVKYSFILALLSGMLNFVPYVGPAITMLFALLFVGTSNSWILALYVLIALLVIQEIDNKALTPLLMKKFMDLPPVLVLVSLLVGGVIFGFLGTVFAVPVSGIIYEFLKEFLEKRKEESLTS